MTAGGTDAWIVLGDFDVTLSSTEHSRPVVHASDRCSIRDFQEAVGRCGLSDLAFVGPLFTWSNNQYGNPICKKLDMALVNPAWRSVFPHSVAKFDMGGVSLIMLGFALIFGLLWLGIENLSKISTI